MSVSRILICIIFVLINIKLTTSFILPGSSLRRKAHRIIYASSKEVTSEKVRADSKPIYPMEISTDTLILTNTFEESTSIMDTINLISSVSPITSYFQGYITNVTILEEVNYHKQVSIKTSIIEFMQNNWLVLGEIIVIILAKVNPNIGATGGPLRPELFISKLGVFFIFFINGIALSIKTSPDKMNSRFKLNALIQLFNFGFIPVFAKLFAKYYPEPSFREGLLVLSALPCTINICVAQTNAAGASMSTAIFNAIFSNVVGVLLTPLLAVWLLGTGQGVSLIGTLEKLGVLVIVPLALGQLSRRTPLLALSERVKTKSRTLSSLLL